MGFNKDVRNRPAMKNKPIFQLVLSAALISTYYALKDMSVIAAFPFGFVGMLKSFGFLATIAGNKQIDLYNRLVERFAKKIERMNLPDDLSKVMVAREMFWKYGIYGNKPFEFNTGYKDKLVPVVMAARLKLGLGLLANNNGKCSDIAGFIVDVYKRLGIDARMVITYTLFKDGKDTGHGIASLHNVGCETYSGKKTTISFYDDLTCKDFLFPEKDGKLSYLLEKGSDRLSILNSLTLLFNRRCFNNRIVYDTNKRKMADEIINDYYSKYKDIDFRPEYDRVFGIEEKEMWSLGFDREGVKTFLNVAADFMDEYFEGKDGKVSMKYDFSKNKRIFKEEGQKVVDVFCKIYDKVLQRKYRVDDIWELNEQAEYWMSTIMPGFAMGSIRGDIEKIARAHTVKCIESRDCNAKTTIKKTIGLLRSQKIECDIQEIYNGMLSGKLVTNNKELRKSELVEQACCIFLDTKVPVNNRVEWQEWFRAEMWGILPNATRNQYEVISQRRIY